MIRVPCPQCGQTLKAPDDAAGRRARCPSCGHVLVVSPAAEASPAAAPPAAAPPAPAPPPVQAAPPAPAAPTPVPFIVALGSPPRRSGARAVAPAASAPAPRAPVRPSAPPAASAAAGPRSRTSLWIILGVGGAVVAAGVVVLLLFLFRSVETVPTGPPAASRELAQPQATAPTAEAAAVLSQLEKVAAAAPQPQAIRTWYTPHVWRIHAGFADKANAIASIAATRPADAFPALVAVFDEQLKRGQRKGALQTAEDMYAAALQTEPQPYYLDRRQGRLETAARAYAVLGLKQRFDDVLRDLGQDPAKVPFPTRPPSGAIAAAASSGKPEDALAVVADLPADRRFDALVSLAGELAARSGPRAALPFFRAALTAAEAPGSSMGMREFRACLMGLCQAGCCDEATARVVKMDAAAGVRSGLLWATARCRAGAGDGEGAVQAAKQGGDLLLAAILEADLGKMTEAADDALQVYAALPALPAQDGAPPPVRGSSRNTPLSVRVRLARHIAIVLFRADRPAEAGAIIADAQGKVQAGQDPNRGTLLALLGLAQLTAVRDNLAAGRAAEALAALQKLDEKGTPGMAPKDLWADIGAMLWKHGQKQEASAAFAKAVEAAQQIPRTAGRRDSRLFPIAATQARAGDLAGALKTRALDEEGLWVEDDDDIADFALAQVAAGDIPGAVQTAAQRETLGERHAAILARISMAVAERGDLDEAFRLFSRHAGRAPRDLYEAALKAGRADLAIDHAGRSRDLEALAEQACRAADANVVQKVLECWVEDLLARNANIAPGPYGRSEPGPAMAPLKLMLEHGDRARAAQIVAAMRKLAAEGRALPLSDDGLAAAVLRAESVDVLVSWVGQIGDAGRRQALLLAAAREICRPFVPEDPDPYASRRPSPPPVRRERDAVERVFDTYCPWMSAVSETPEGVPHIPPGSPRRQVHIE